MKREINFYIPDFYYFKDINLHLINLIKNHPEYFYDDISIGAVYGSFPNMIWNGGRVIIGEQESLPNIKNIIDDFNNINVPIRFTCTNSLINEKHCNDFYCNTILEYAARNPINEVIVNSSILEKHLRKEYPNLHFILSTTRCIRDPIVYNQLSSKYDLMVIDFRDNKNQEFLSQLNCKNKCEILINAECTPYCLQREHHYRTMDIATLNYDERKNFDCQRIDKINNFYDLIKLNDKSFLTNEELYNDYLKAGFFNFKIEGRVRPPLYAIESYIYYLVKPEFKDYIRYSLLSKII